MIGSNLLYLHAVGIYSAGIYSTCLYTSVHVYTIYSITHNIFVFMLYLYASCIKYHTHLFHTSPTLYPCTSTGSVWRPVSRIGTASAPSAVRSSGKTTTALCSLPSRWWVKQGRGVEEML